MKEEIKERILKIQNGQVPEGYKKTKIGIVPNEWEEIKFDSLFEEYNEYTKNLEQYPLYSLTIEGGVVKKTEKYERSHLVKKENAYKILPPDYYAYNPMNLRFGAVSRHKGKQLVSVSSYYNIFTTKKKTDLKFMDNFLISSNMITYYNKVSTGSLLEKQRVHFSQFLNFVLQLPNQKDREKIGEILTTQDKVIELKEKLIEEKQKKKKYLMYNLLTGKKRLKGFEGEWKKSKLGECLIESKKRNRDLITDNVLSVSNKVGFINQNKQFGKNVASKDLSNYKLIENGVIAYNPSRINVGSIAKYNGYDIGIVSPMYTVLSLKNSLDSSYFMFFVQTREFFKQMKVLLLGSVRDSLNFSDLCKIKILLPEFKEQIAIANILSTADKEIELLQEELEQEKQKKKSLMQLLLTGIVRTGELQ